MQSPSLPFHLVDVFASEPLFGNGLAVFITEQWLPTEAMQRITCEMRQFESIFLQPTRDPTIWGARIFTMEEELSFAGHPILGAAALLHARQFGDQDGVTLQFRLGERMLAARSRVDGDHYYAEMAQGEATLGSPLLPAQVESFLSALNLDTADLAPRLPLRVVSTGLPYLIVPLQSGLERAHIATRKFAALLDGVGAQFVYVLDVGAKEGRTWDNEGRVEDIATGSAAGPAAAYLVHHGRAHAGEPLVLQQGRFLNRPSRMHAITSLHDESVSVGGQVCMTGSGSLALPRHDLSYPLPTHSKESQ